MPLFQCCPKILRTPNWYESTVFSFSYYSEWIYWISGTSGIQLVGKRFRIPKQMKIIYCRRQLRVAIRRTISTTYFGSEHSACPTTPSQISFTFSKNMLTRRYQSDHSATRVSQRNYPSPTRLLQELPGPCNGTINCKSSVRATFQPTSTRVPCASGTTHPQLFPKQWLQVIEDT